MTADHDFQVLGDLTERTLGEYQSAERRLIVRMFVGESTFDEEIVVASVDELRSKVNTRMAELEKKPELELLADAARPQIDNGHAIHVPEAS